MSNPVFATSDEAQKAGWYSRRHKTAEAARAAREQHQANKSKASRRARGRKMNSDRARAELDERVSRRSSWRSRFG